MAVRPELSGGGRNEMARMLGERLFPESVTQRRRQLRNRVQDLREPVRRFREQNVPGPDLVGRAESSVMSLRDRFVDRDSVLSGIMTRRGGSSGGGGSGGGGSSGTSNSGTGSQTQEMM